MTSVATVGCIGVGTCPKHKKPRPYVTTFISGANTVSANGLPVAVAGVTMGVSSCGHPTIAVTGTPTHRVEGLPLHRVGDMGQNFGPYIVTTGSPNVLSAK